MPIKKFLLISVLLHAIIIAGIYFLPEQQTKKARDFITRLVTPEEAERPKQIPMPPIKPAPPAAIKKIRPALKPPPPAPRFMPKTPLTKDMPVVPGRGKDEGKPLPEGVSPRFGNRESRGDEGTEELSSKPGYMPGGRQPGKRGPTDREKLFDSSVIGNTIVKGDGSRKKDDAITFDTKDYRYAGYMQKLREKIESIWEYPPDALKKRLYGDLKINFTIKKDGRLGAVELVRTSGYKVLDDAALKALRDGEPYWPIPDEWGMDSYTINGHFFYNMYGYGIR